MADEDIDYTDIPEIGEDLFEQATHVPAKQLITIRLDADIVAWLKRKGRGYQTRTNKILRAVMESQEKPTKNRAGATK